MRKKQKTVNKKCRYCGLYNNRGISVDAIIMNNNKILLIKRKNDPYKNYWSLPGGFVDWDETAEQTVIREVKEETGLFITKLKLFNVYSNPQRHPKQVISIVYDTQVAGELIAGDDAQQAAWFDLDNLPKVLGFDHQQIITDFLQRLVVTDEDVI